MVGHGQGPCQVVVGGQQHEGLPVGRGQRSEVVWSKVAMRSRAQPPGERDERGVGRGRAPGARRAMRERLVQRVGPPAHGVGAALEVAPQRVARRRGRRARPTRWSISATASGVVTRSSSSVATQSATRSVVAVAAS